MKIFITGATGFVGTQVINRLEGSGHELHCLVRKHHQANERLQSLGAKLFLGDVTDKQSIMKGMQGCDWVIHLAGHYTFWESDNRLYRKVNVEGTQNVMECALETKPLKVVHISTVVTFGKPAESPFTEKSKPGPVRFSRYARTKYEGDQIVMSLQKNHGLPAVIIYPCSICGARDPKASGQYVSDIIHKRLPFKALNNSNLTFVHVRNVAEAIVRAREKPGNIGEKYLIGDKPVTFGEVNKMVSEISGVSLPKLSLPDFLVMINAYILTGISRLTKKAPPWGMSVDQMKTMKKGFRADGSKAEKELGFKYTPFRIALEEEIAAVNKTGKLF